MTMVPLIKGYRALVLKPEISGIMDCKGLWSRSNLLLWYRNTSSTI